MSIDDVGVKESAPETRVIFRFRKTATGVIYIAAVFLGRFCRRKRIYF